MKPDSQIKQDVEAELRWDPRIDSADIAVAVSQGVVTLTGFVRSYGEKYDAEDAVKRVAGVAGVANDLEVRLPSIDERPDPEIAREVVAAVRGALPLASDGIRVVVNRGWVTLEGEVSWNYQRERAEKSARRAKGVKGVINSIQLKTAVAPSEVKRKIEEALRRSAELDAKSIQVQSRDGEVILRGKVRSWLERKEAERAAWAAPGVKRVENEIAVSF